MSEDVFRFVLQIADRSWRTWLGSLENFKRRYRIAAAAHNLIRILLNLLGVGKPRALQSGLFAAAISPPSPTCTLTAYSIAA